MENTVRAVMHPADEFLAMAGLIDAGQPIEDVAARFGVSERHVKQRLRLGKVAPELLDEFRAGTVTLEVMTAFTLGVDHETQLAVWRQVRTQPYVTAHAVRCQTAEAPLNAGRSRSSSVRKAGRSLEAMLASPASVSLGSPSI
jgi:ParB family chromosome partitioning protein